ARNVLEGPAVPAQPSGAQVHRPGEALRVEPPEPSEDAGHAQQVPRGQGRRTPPL
ncbi:MAG: hypothetical protein AVDCRST_MAG54-3734, partial [uncultured Actinomycetospora sp.]